MKKYIALILLTFLVKVKVPFGADLTYKHVQSYEAGPAGYSWTLLLEDGRKAVVPTFWTTIEEEKEEK